MTLSFPFLNKNEHSLYLDKKNGKAKSKGDTTVILVDIPNDTIDLFPYWDLLIVILIAHSWVELVRRIIGLGLGPMYSAWPTSLGLHQVVSQVAPQKDKEVLAKT